MTTSLANNQAARDAVLARTRRALGKSADRASARADAEAYVEAHRHGPRPAMPPDLVTRFVERARDLQSTVERLAEPSELPAAVARYLSAVDASAESAVPAARAGVCWPEFAELHWQAAGLSVEARPTTGQDRLGITGAFCAIAETGTLVLLPGEKWPTATALLPDTHVAVVRAERIVSGMEEAFALVRTEQGRLPRAVNLISGPSRTGDIEQTIVLGAHGPYQVHIIVLG